MYGALLVRFVFLVGIFSSCSSEEEQDTRKEVCFNRLGCFSLETPWKSLLRPLPAPHTPDAIDTQVYFYSKPDIETRHYPELTPSPNLAGIPYDKTKKTVFITHGFASNGNSSWMNDLKNAYLSTRDANVFIVDWGKGASLWNYLQVASNTRIVGKELAMLVQHLITKEGANPEDIHLIGHSLGAQISSYVAKQVKNLGRLTALDPAQPAFEGFEKEVRLDATDAEFVEVVHTDARPFIPTLGFGMIKPVGHVDFYVNGGFDQPGCIVPPVDKIPKIMSLTDLAKYPVEVIGEMVACPHGRSYEYLTEAYKNTHCVFSGHKASLDNIAKTVGNTVSQGVLVKYIGLSESCSADDCIPLNYDSVKSLLRGNFVVSTRGSSPYCTASNSDDNTRSEDDPPKSGNKTSVLGMIGDKITSIFG